MANQKKLSTQQMNTHFSYVLKDFPFITKSITSKTQLGGIKIERIDNEMLNVYYDNNDFVTKRTKEKIWRSEATGEVTEANAVSVSDACVDNTLRDPVREEYDEEIFIDPNGSDKEYDNGQKMFVKCFFENILENDDIVDKMIKKITERANVLRNPNLNEWFEAFWKAWPKGTLKGSKAKAWEKICAMNPTEEDCREIGQGLKDNAEQYRLMDKYHQWHPVLPMVTTWLNQKRWEDSYVVEEAYWSTQVPDPRIKQAHDETAKKNIIANWSNMLGKEN